MASFRKIGIVGGVGPYAGILLNKMIFDESRADCDRDYPEVYLLSASGRISDRTEYILSPELSVNPAYAIADIAQMLETLGAEVIVIPCNTAHSPIIFSVIQREIKRRKIKARLINMVNEVISEIMLLRKREHKINMKIGLFATKGTNRSGVYRNAIERSAGLEFVPLPDDYIDLVHDTIYNREYGLKATGEAVSDRVVEDLSTAMDYLVAKGADCIIFGCTELSMAIPRLKSVVPVVDTLRVLALAALRKKYTVADIVKSASK